LGSGLVEVTNGFEDNPSYDNEFAQIVVIHITVTGISVIGAEFGAA
jgi:hypothetical protein